MPRVTRDANEGSGEYVPLPNGSYHLKVEAADQKADADKDKDQLMVKCTVAAGPHAGKTSTVWFSMKPQAMWKLKLFMEAAGIPYDEVETDKTDAEGKPVTSVSFDTEEFPGAELMAEATFQEKFQNNSWGGFRGAPGSEPAQETQQQSPAPQQQAPAQGDEAPQQRRRRAIRQ